MWTWRITVISLIVCFAGCLCIEPVFCSPDLTTTSLRLESIKAFRTGHNSGISGLCFTPDSKSLVTSGDGSIRIWNARTGKRIHRIRMPRGEASSVGAITVSKDGKMIISNGYINKDAFIAPAADIETRFWDLQTGREFEHLRLIEWAEQVTPVALSPDRTLLVAGAWWYNNKALGSSGVSPGYEKMVHLHNMRTNTSEVLKPLFGIANNVQCFHFSSDSKQLTICQEDLVQRIEIPSRTTIFSLRLPEKPGSRDQEVSPCGHFLASVSWSGTVLIRSLPEGTLVHEVENVGNAYSIRFCPSSDHLFVGTENGHSFVHAFDMTTGAVAYSLPLAASPVMVDVAPDESTLAAADYDGKVYLVRIVK